VGGGGGGGGMGGGGAGGGGAGGGGEGGGAGVGGGGGGGGEIGGGGEGGGGGGGGVGGGLTPTFVLYCDAGLSKTWVCRASSVSTNWHPCFSGTTNCPALVSGGATLQYGVE
jgi:hypothetical protein